MKAVLLLVLCYVAVSGSTPLLNVGFEEAIGWNNWWCAACTGVLSEDAYSGNYSFLASGR